MIGQRKAFYRQRIPESVKETIDIDILVASKNGDRKIMQSIKMTIRPPLRKRKCQGFKRKLKVKDQQSCMSIFVVCLTIPSSN